MAPAYFECLVESLFQMKPKILHLITGLEIGGAEKALAAVLPHMQNFEHVVCSLRGDGPVGELLRKNNIKTYFLKNGKGLSLHAIINFYRIVKTENPDLLITYLVQADFFGRIFGRIFGIKKICSFLRSSLDEPKYKRVFLLEKLTKFLIIRYFAVSSTVKETYVKRAGISPQKIAVIPNGLESHPINPGSSGYRQKLGIPKTSMLISCVAKLRPEKNHLLLLEIFKKFKAKSSDSVIIFAGEGPEETKIREYIKNHNLQTSVLLTGNVANVTELLLETDIFILLSSFEGMSNALLEAMAAGCPILASDIGPNRELIEDKKNGLLVPLSNPDIIFEKLAGLSANSELKQTMKQANLEKAKLYTLKNTAKIFTQEINRVIH